MTTKEQEELDKKEEERMYFERMLSDSYIDPSEDIDYPPVAISMGSYSYNTRSGLKTYPIPIGTYGNFSFVQAPPKVGKSYFISLLTSVYLKEDIGIRGGKMRGHRERKEVVHFDTEQGKFHASKVFKRPLEMAGHGFDGYHCLALRAMSPTTRLNYIDWYLEYKMEDVGLVIIDGIADLCNNVNCVEEASRVTQKVMEWTANYDCHMVLVIHSNFGSDKPTGHLGSFLEKKTETQIQLEKNPVDKSAVDVKCKRSRNKPFDEFTFRIDRFGLPEVSDIDINLIP